MLIACAQINPTIGDIPGNTQLILRAIEQAKARGARLVLFPELALSGYPPEDFLQLDAFIDACEAALQSILPSTKGIAVFVGLPRHNREEGEKDLYNSAAVVDNGVLLGYYDKCLLPTYDVFDERRYFHPGCEAKLWKIDGKRVAVTICEDIWQHSAAVKDSRYGRDPVAVLREEAPDLVLNLSSSPYHYNKLETRVAVSCAAAKAVGCPLILCNQVGGNDSLIFDGHSLFVTASGEICCQAKGFEEDLLMCDTEGKRCPVVPKEDPTGQLYDALVLGLRDYFKKLNFRSACLGLSGGIDSAVVACLAAEALGPENVLGISMPSRYSSDHSLSDAKALAENLGIQYKVIPIESTFQHYLDLLHPYFSELPPNETEENLQARVRGMILMAFSNKLGHIVLSPGNKSEIALGYCTLYGDTCGGLGVINDVVKTRVYALAEWINRRHEVIPEHILTKPPSAELRPNQRDTDSLPEYEVVDRVLQAYVEQHQDPEAIAQAYGYDLDLVKGLVRKIHFNEYKRVQMPPGLRVTEKAFSKGRRFPIVQRWVR
ncbi:MAG: NAD+ synthase [Chlamydiia bacterium]|nr:NAD+ synthase [Chlamydiia bacterium]